MVPWVRFSPYLVGVITGYFMHRTNGKKLRIHWVWLFANISSSFQLSICIMWVLSISTALAVLLGLHGYHKGHHLSKFAKVVNCKAFLVAVSGFLLHFFANRLGAQSCLAGTGRSTQLGWPRQELHGTTTMGATWTSHLLCLFGSLLRPLLVPQSVRISEALRQCDDLCESASFLTRIHFSMSTTQFL